VDKARRCNPDVEEGKQGAERSSETEEEDASRNLRSFEAGDAGGGDGGGATARVRARTVAAILCHRSTPARGVAKHPTR
jgi:hypothetical protein